MSVIRAKVVDPRWNGIIEVLVQSLDGTVRWEPGSVVLRLPFRQGDGRDADLDALRLALALVGVPVAFDASLVTLPHPPLVEFLRKLVDSGLSVKLGPLAA